MCVCARAMINSKRSTYSASASSWLPDLHPEFGAALKMNRILGVELEQD